MNKLEEILSSNGFDGNCQDWISKVDAVTDEDVQRELSNSPGRFSYERLAVLISPAASDYLEQMAQQARALTIQRFGKTMLLYVPLYVSNVCINSCEYCGYNTAHDFKRTRLSIDEALEDAKHISQRGFKHILLLSGEDPQYASVDYFCELASKLRKNFSSIGIEIYPMDQDDYAKLVAAGVDDISIYQETYNKDIYAEMHKKGPKSNYSYRLNTPDRAAAAGIRRIGLGALLGLSDWRSEVLALAAHADYLMKRYWKSQVSFSFPRIRPAHEVDRQRYTNLVSEKLLAQIMIALRLCFSDAGITLSTRENADFRRNMIHLGVTKLSAGSKTNPGGYSGDHDDAVEQFQISDESSPEEVAKMLRDAGYETVWKDWDSAFTK